MPAVNVWAVLLAAVSAFMLGGLWYGPLFKNAWCREAGVDPNKPNGHPAAVFGGAFVLSLIAAYVFALFLGPAPGLPNLLLDVGQGALGFTLAMASGRVVADLLAGRPPPVPMDGFDAAGHGVVA